MHASHQFSVLSVFGGKKNLRAWLPARRALPFIVWSYDFSPDRQINPERVTTCTWNGIHVSPSSNPKRPHISLKPPLWEPQGVMSFWQHPNVLEYFMAINEISPLEAADTASKFSPKYTKWRATIPRFVLVRRCALATCEEKQSTVLWSSCLLFLSWCQIFSPSRTTVFYKIRFFCFDFWRSR